MASGIFDFIILTTVASLYSSCLAVSWTFLRNTSMSNTDTDGTNYHPQCPSVTDFKHFCGLSPPVVATILTLSYRGLTGQ